MAVGNRPIQMQHIACLNVIRTICITPTAAREAHLCAPPQDLFVENAALRAALKLRSKDVLGAVRVLLRYLYLVLRRTACLLSVDTTISMEVELSSSITMFTDVFKTKKQGELQKFLVNYCTTRAHYTFGMALIDCR